MRTLYTILALLISIPAFAQEKDVPFEKDYFRDNKKEFKDALKEFEDGNYYFFGDPGRGMWPNYGKALDFYKKAYTFNPKSALLNFRMGLCYLNSLERLESLDYLLKAYELKNTVDPMIHYYIGQSYQIHYEWDKAIIEYEYYRKTLSQRDNVEEIFLVNKRIEECQTGIDLTADPVRVWIDNLGPEINTEYPEYAPLVSADESIIFFTARRPSTIGGGMAEDDNKHFEDIYSSNYDFEANKWEPNENMGEDVNSKSHDATAGLSPDGRTLFVYLGFEGAGDIYQTNYEEGEWTKIKTVGKNINTRDFHETSAFLSYDGKKLYYVSEKEGGFGGHDIYVSTWDEEKERWEEGVNMGPVINTKYDEAGAFIHPDGKTLYFASKGHETMGGYDIFYSTLENGVWTKPVNIGYPINTPDDDVHFVTDASGRYGYFASFRKDGYGEKDIYRITFLGPEKEPILSSEDNLIASIANPVKEISIEPQVEVSNKNLIILKGFIRDAKTLEPVRATIELMDNEEDIMIAEFTSDSETGKYLISLPGGKNYGLAVKAEGYLFHSENFIIPETSGYREYQRDVDLKKVSVGETIVLKNIFYDYDKATLRPESKTELDRLTSLLEENPTLKIELSAHTDSRGSDSYNMDLSQRRAQSVVDYLIDKGVSKDRLVAKGYGETKLVVTDAEIAKMATSAEKEDGHQQNRRTEFKILEL